MQKDLTEHEKTLEDLQGLCKKMCSNLKESSSKFDLKNKITTIERPLKDLQKKLGRFSLLGYFLFTCVIHIEMQHVKMQFIFLNNQVFHHV